jgi:hypothetical protein
LDKTFDMFDEKALHRPPSTGIRDWICDEIQTRFGSDDRNSNSAATGAERKQSEPSAENEIK